MKFSNLHSDDLPNIDMSIKRCINSGQWFLFKASENEVDNSDAFYMLKVNNVLYSLDRSGNPLNEMNLDSELVMNEIFYFDDIDSPTSLSNQLIA